MNLISIIIPCYNSEKTLPNLLSHISKEDLTDTEILLINDGSTDNTEVICKSYADTDNHFVYIKQPNRGVSSARNNGIKNAEGKYLAFYDSDDDIFPGTIQLYKDSIKTESTFYAYNYETIFTYNNKKKHALHQKSKKYSSKEYTKLFLQRKVALSVFSILLNKEFLNKNNIRFNTNLTFAEDYCFLFSVLFKTDNIEYNNRFIYRYMISENSTSNKSHFSIKRFNGFIALKELLDSEIDNSNQEILISAKKFFIADIYSANLEIYFRSKTIDKTFEKYAKQYKPVLKHIIHGRIKYLTRIYFFKTIPLHVLFFINRHWNRRQPILRTQTNKE